MHIFRVFLFSHIFLFNIVELYGNGNKMDMAIIMNDLFGIKKLFVLG
jgi:hypothetical protein